MWTDSPAGLLLPNMPSSGLNDVVRATVDPVTGLNSCPVSGGDGLQSAIIFGDSMTQRSNTYYKLPVISAARASGIVTVVKATHGLYTGMTVSMVNMFPTTFNANNVAITYVDANTYTYPSAGADGSAANLSANQPMQIVIDSSFADNGYWFWLNSKCGGAFKLLRNAGRAGDDSAQMLARMQTDVIQYAPGWVFILNGYNDVQYAGLTAAQIIANQLGMTVLARNAGIKVCLISPIPITTGNTNAKIQVLLAVRRWQKLFARSTPGVYFADAWQYLVDATNATKGSALSGMLEADGIHPSPRGCERIAYAIQQAITGFYRPIERRVSSNADNYGVDATNANIFDAAPWTNSGGTAPSAPTSGTNATGLASDGSGVGTFVNSCPARADAIGYDQQTVATSGGATEWCRIKTSAAISGRYSDGDKIQFVGEIALTNVSGSNLKGINAYITTTGGASVSHYIVQQNAASASEFIQSDQTLLFVSPEIIIPAGTTGFNLFIQTLFSAVGTALTIKHGRMSIEKL